MEKQLQLEVEKIFSAEDLTDQPSRWEMDKGDHTLDHSLFRHLKQLLQHFAQPEVYMFASPGNGHLERFVATYPHWEVTAVNALTCPLEEVKIARPTLFGQ